MGKSVRGAGKEKEGDLAERLGSQPDPCYLTPAAPRALGAALRGPALSDPSHLTLLFAFCLDVEWTEWFDQDKVSHAKGGDKISDVQAAHPGKICNRPIHIQVPKSD